VIPCLPLLGKGRVEARRPLPNPPEVDPSARGRCGGGHVGEAVAAAAEGTATVQVPSRGRGGVRRST
jgi:hypothetical protein